jgi:hypothetical protein
LGLLALTLRDLIEDDIPLGFGAAKGYGACHAAITDIRIVGLDAQSPHWSLLEHNDATHIDFNQLDFTIQPPLEEVQFVIAEAIKAFHDKVDSFSHSVSPQGDMHAVS